MAMTVTPNNDLALMQIFIDYQPIGLTQTTATIWRGLSATGPWEELATIDLLDEQGYYADNTMPFDTPLWYRATNAEIFPFGQFIVGPNQITTVDGGAWLRDPLRPWADIEMEFCETPEVPCTEVNRMSWVGFGTFGRATDAGLFDRLNTEKPADVYARRKNLSTDINFFTNSLVMKDRVYELFTVGGPLYLTLPPVYGWDDDFIQTTADLTEDYVDQRDQRKPWRRWAAPVRTVERPTGPAQGTVCANWCAVDEAYATFADMTAAGGTWGDIADGSFLCGDIVVEGFGFGAYGDGPYGDGG